MENKKIVDITGLNRYHEKLKNDVLNTKQNVIDDLEDIRSGAAAGAVAEQNAKEYADDLVKNEDGSVKFDNKGAAATAEQNAKDYADGLATNYDAAGSASAAQAAAEQKATELNTAMNNRVEKLEAIDHEKLALDASATAVAAIVAGAESDFDTLKEVADWIASDKEGSAELQATVSGHTESINTINGDINTINGDIDALEANKQDVISDLETIRSGATAGATALQEDDLQFATDGDIDGLFA